MKGGVYIGDLKARISVCSDVKTPSITGEPSIEESVVKNCWANQTEKSAQEDEDGKVRFLYTTEFIVRYDAQLTKGRAIDMYVKDADGLKYDIVGVLEKIPKRYLQINTIRRG